MVTLIILSVFFALILAFLAYTSDSHWTFKAASLAVFLTISVLAYEHYLRELGAPIPIRPEGEMAYNWHIVTQDMMFVVWLYEDEEDGGKGHRLYTYPFNRDDAAKYEQAKNQVIDGMPVTMLIGEDEGDPGIEFVDFPIPNENVIKPPEQSQPRPPGPPH